MHNLRPQKTSGYSKGDNLGRGGLDRYVHSYFSFSGANRKLLRRLSQVIKNIDLKGEKPK